MPKATEEEYYEDYEEYYEDYGGYVPYEAGRFLKTIQYLTYAFNGVFFVFASILFALCLWIRFDPDMDDYVRNIHFEHYWNGIIVLMIGATVVMIGSCVAWCGAFFWNITLIIAYVVISIVSFTMNLSGATYMLLTGLEGTRAFPYIREHFRGLIYRYNIDMDAKRTVDIIQEYIGCCGGYSPNDWEEIHLPVPNSCRDQVTGNQYGHSCAEVVSWYLELRTGLVSGISLCICFLQLFTVLFAFFMYKGLRERRRAYEKAYQEYGEQQQQQQ